MAELMKDLQVKVDDKKKEHFDEKDRADKLQKSMDETLEGNKIHVLENKIEDMERDELKFDE